jgi:hypothetical protein
MREDVPGCGRRVGADSVPHGTRIGADDGTLPGHQTGSGPRAKRWDQAKGRGLAELVFSMRADIQAHKPRQCGQFPRTPFGDPKRQKYPRRHRVDVIRSVGLCRRPWNMSALQLPRPLTSRHIASFGSYSEGTCTPLMRSWRYLSTQPPSGDICHRRRFARRGNPIWPTPP